MQRDAMVYKHAAPRRTSATKMQPEMPPASAPSPPLLHSVLRLMPFAWKKSLPYVINVKFIQKLKIIYTAVFVLELITKYTHHKLKASAAWLSLLSWHILGQVDLLSRRKMANIFFWHKSCKGSVHLMLCNQIIKIWCLIKVLHFY